MVGYIVRLIVGVAALHLLLSADVARAQTPPPEALAAARELVETMHLNEQYKAVLPGIFKTLKPSIVQGRAEVDRHYDALVPVMVEAFQARVSELTDAAAIIYARNFSADEIHALNEFYQTPTGQKFLQRMPTLMQELMTAGSKFGQSVAGDLRDRIIDELRNEGVNP